MFNWYTTSMYTLYICIYGNMDQFIFVLSIAFT